MVKRYVIRGRSSKEIAESIERGIERGMLARDALLPSVRGLARELGVSPGTVAAAYRVLRQRGLVAGQPGARTRVSAAGPPLAARPVVPVPEGVRDLSSGNPDPEFLPPLSESVCRIDPSHHFYGEAPTLPELVDQGREQFRADGVAADEIAVVSGAMDGIERILAMQLRSGDRVAIEDPCYVAVLDLLSAMGLVPEPVAVDERGIVPGALRAALASPVRACILTPRAQNPTSAAFDLERAGELRAVLREFPDVLVIENDHAGAVAGAPFFTLSAGRERWAVLRSVSKTLGPDLRLALLAGDSLTVSRVEERQLVGCGWVSHLLQGLVADLWARLETQGLLRKAERSYTMRRTMLVEELADRGVRSLGRTGLNVWIPVREEVPVIRGLLQLGWALKAGEAYRLRSEPFVRVTVAALKPSEIPTLARDVAYVVRPRRATYPA